MSGDSKPLINYTQGRELFCVNVEQSFEVWSNLNNALKLKSNFILIVTEDIYNTYQDQATLHVQYS